MEDLMVRDRFSKDMSDDLVCTHESNRGGIKNKKVCRLTALTADRDPGKSRYVEVRGIGNRSCDLDEYLDVHPEMPRDFAHYQTSIFMNADTRQRFNFTPGKRYRISLQKAGLYGNCCYFVAHPDRYSKLWPWVALCGLLLAILGYSLKDWIPMLFR